MSDRPDHTLPVSISAVEIATLPIDIKAQTLGTVAIDISAQTLGQVNVNIKASAITLDIDIKAQTLGNLVVKAMAGTGVTNLGEISNGDFEKTHVINGITYADDWLDPLGSHRRGVTAWSGFSSITLKKMTPAVGNGVYQALSPSIPTDNIAAFAITSLNQDEDNRTFKIQLFYSDGTSSTQTITATAWAGWEKTDLTYTAGKYIIGMRIYTDDANLTAFDLLLLDALSLRYREELQGIINTVDIDVVAQTIGNIEIDIKAQTVDLNIKTSGGVNLVIDKLTQTAYVEDRRTLSNNGETALWYSHTGNNRKGKFFPRGCRGFINTVDVHCKDAAAAGGTITVYLSPHPSMGYIASADATVTAEQSAAWKSATFNRMWNYDSMFIFIVCSVGDVKYGYDGGAPCDAFDSTDAGATWTPTANRAWFRAIMKAMTVGDLPVSGTVNTIEIPSLSTTKSAGATDLPPETEVTLVTFNGAGSHEYTQFYGTYDITVYIRIYCDDVLVEDVRGQELADYGNATPKFSLLDYTAASTFTVLLTACYAFQRKFEIRAYNAHNANTYSATIRRSICNMVK